jgi:hypothetical protein
MDLCTYFYALTKILFQYKKGVANGTLHLSINGCIFCPFCNGFHMFVLNKYLKKTPHPTTIFQKLMLRGFTR